MTPDDPNAPLHFIQLADPQFGMFAALSRWTDEFRETMRQRGIVAQRHDAPIDGFEEETRLFETAIAEANRLRPAFVVVCGDMVNDLDDPAQLAEVLRIAGRLDEGIALHWVAGNHDVCSDFYVPTAESLATYRANFGADRYAFQHGDTSFLVLNSQLIDHPEGAPEEAEAQFEFLRTELATAGRRGGPIVAFQHQPIRASDPLLDESMAISSERRGPLLELLHAHEVAAVFTGHLHQNDYIRDGELEMVATAPVGYPLNGATSGYRVVRIAEERIEHRFHPFGEGPDRLDAG